MSNKLGQIWIETVIYTLIAFLLIGAVLAFAKPKIEEMQDKAIIEQSIGLVKDIDSTVREIVQGGSGNKRKLEISIKKGDFIIHGTNDSLVFEIDSNYVYSELGKEILSGNLIIKTEKISGSTIVTLTRNYEDYNITFNGIDQEKSLPKAATPYNLFIENKGKEDEKWMIDFTLA